MRRILAFGLAFCVGLMVLAVNVAAAPPPNDVCSGAQVINGAGPFPFLSEITTNIHEATLDGDPQTPTNCYPGLVSRSIWYQFSPAVDGLYTVSLKFTATTMQDTLLGIYTSPGGAGCAGPFEQFACNDDVGALQSALTTNFSFGATYYIVVWHTLTNAPVVGQRSVQLKVNKVEQPSNDLCLGAVEIPADAGQLAPYRTPVRNSHLATTNSDPVGPQCTNAQRSVWYKFRPSQSGNYIISTCTNTTATTIFHSLLAVYSSSSGDCSGTLNREICNSGFCGTSAAVIQNLVPGAQYYIVVWDVENEPGPDETDVQLFVQRQGPPSVTTLGHANVTPTSVTFNGAANPKGLLTRGFFQWGSTPSYGNTTANSTLGTGVTDFPFSRTELNLLPGSTIHYRAAATNQLGVAFGDGMSVTLPLLPPTITSLTKEPDGWLILFTAADDFIHMVEISTNLTTWTTLGEAVWLGDGLYQYFDEGPPDPVQRFYRIKL